MAFKRPTVRSRSAPPLIFLFGVPLGVPSLRPLSTFSHSKHFPGRIIHGFHPARHRFLRRRTVIGGETSTNRATGIPRQSITANGESPPDFLEPADSHGLRVECEGGEKPKSLAWIRSVWLDGSDSDICVYNDQNNYQKIDERQFSGCFIHRRGLSQYLIFIGYKAHSVPRFGFINLLKLLGIFTG